MQASEKPAQELSLGQSSGPKAAITGLQQPAWPCAPASSLSVQIVKVL
jgi:hypothetical protein